MLCPGLFLPIYFLFITEDISILEKERKGGREKENSKRGWKERGRKGKERKAGERGEERGRSRGRERRILVFLVDSM